MSDQEAAAPQGDERDEDVPPPVDGDDKPAYLSAAWLASDRTQTLANVLTIIVALAAIGLSVWEGFENRRHNRLSVLPHLESIEADISSAAPIEMEYFLVPSGVDSLHAVGYALRNSGLGPAVLEDVLVFRGSEGTLDTTPSDSVYQYFRRVESDLAELPFETGLFRYPYSKGAMLQAGTVHHFATVVVPYSTVSRDTLDRSPTGLVKDEALERHSVVFCYCSVYGEDCDMTFLGAEPPVEDVCGF